MCDQKPVMTPIEVEKYNKDGYFSFNRPLFPEADFVRLKAIFEENLEKYGPDDLDVIHFRDQRLMEFLLDDNVLDLVEKRSSSPGNSNIGVNLPEPQASKEHLWMIQGGKLDDFVSYLRVPASTNDS